jgi:hypothetical protein
VTNNRYFSVEQVGGGKLDRSADKPSNMAANPPQSSSLRRVKMGDTTVGSFKIEDEIGKGSFATVFRGVERVCSSDNKTVMALSASLVPPLGP